MKKILILLLTLFLISCGSTKYIEIPVPEIHKEYITKIDTTIIQDSVFINRYVKADTVFLDRFKYKYIEHITRDTLMRTDTVSVVQKVNVDVPYVPVYYKRINLIFWIAVVLFILYVAFRIYIRR